MKRAMTLFPLLVLPVLLYNVIAMSGGDAQTVPPILGRLDAALFQIPMLSGVPWRFTLADLLLVFGLIMLFAEIVKATSTKSDSIMNHAASMFVLIFCLIEFLLFKNFATSTFFLLMLMCFLDVLAGVMVTIVSARRDFGVGDGVVR